MPRTATSLRQERLALIADMRAGGRAWSDIADEMATRYGVNRRVAFRLAHGWSQREAAERWTDRWPADPKNDKQISGWEQWPGSSGHCPSLAVLSRLAELYECAVADLLVDVGSPRPRVAPLTPAALLALAARWEELGVEEIARQITASGVPLSRRHLLLASAALSLAAADPAVAGAPASSPSTVSTSPLAGVWHSRYVYPSTGRGGSFSGEHYVVLRQQGEQITGQSVPAKNGSRLRLDLTVRSPVATGTWTEWTSRTDYYQGATYHGTVQLIVDPMGRRMDGRWVGFGKDFTVNSDEWTLRWVDGATSAAAVRAYHDKL